MSSSVFLSCFAYAAPTMHFFVYIARQLSLIDVILYTTCVTLVNGFFPSILNTHHNSCFLLQLANVELRKAVLIPGLISALKVEEQLLALGKDLHQAAASCEILLVLLQVGCELQNTS